MHSLLTMHRVSNTANAHPAEGDEALSEADEPPDESRRSAAYYSRSYAKSKPTAFDEKRESLLTRALLSEPENGPPAAIASRKPSIGIRTALDRGFHSGPSTAELTSDAETTSPFRSQTPSPPHPAQYGLLPRHINNENLRPQHITISSDPHELEVEANLGRKRCITFACGRKLDFDTHEKPLGAGEKKESPVVKRKSALTFACPSVPGRSSPKETRTSQPPASRKISLMHKTPGPPPSPTLRKSVPQSASPSTSKGASQSNPIRVTGLGKFQPSETTRFHEFGSSVEEDEDWVNESTYHKPRIMLSDCMRKENAIRKLGDEVEEEVRDEEAAANENGDSDNDEDDDETVLDNWSDDGNESDNEAGFASDDDDSEDGSEYNFWTPAMATAATSVEHSMSLQQLRERADSNLSMDSLEESTSQVRRRRRVPKPVRFRPGTPSLPDSTDFVCGTLDEDRPLEVAYKSCMEERRRSKHVPVPQDIDPSFPTSDPEDEDEEDEVDVAGNPDASPNPYRGRERRQGHSGGSGRSSPNHSVSSRHSPPFPRPGRLRSPPPPMRLRSPPPPSGRPSTPPAYHPVRPAGINITGLAQRPTRIRTNSLPRTPNPFFARLDQRHRSPRRSPAPSQSQSPSDRGHTRGAVDIVAGLEKKRQKRKEKFWRQHCRKAAKEQLERKPIPGRGAERMKELGLEVAERFRAYGFGQDTQLVLSI